MRIDMYCLPTMPEEAMSGKTAVIIDALRATSTIITALENGCEQVIPVVEWEDAAALAQSMQKMGRDNILLGGERGGRHIEGFDLSNSPLEYKKEKMTGKTLIMTTSNGTKAINAAKSAKTVLISAFINAKKTAEKAAALGDDIVIVCAGSNGRFSLEDTLAGGAVISHLREMADLDMYDLAIAAEMLYLQAKDDLHEPLSKTNHYNHLVRIGFGSDLDYCLKADTADALPCFAEGVIK